MTIYFHISFKYLIACNRRCIKDLHEWKESIKLFQKIKTFVRVQFLSDENYIWF